jgi:predicted nucleic acid-binding protein
MLSLLRTYVDSGVLIWAAQGAARNAEVALRFISDPLREYVTSDYIRLEIIPKATFHANHSELDFYETFFRANIRCIPTSESLIREAMAEGCKTGISGIDALHIACAVFAGAEEFITTEKASKPMHRTDLIRVTCIRPEEKPAQ